METSPPPTAPKAPSRTTASQAATPQAIIDVHALQKGVRGIPLPHIFFFLMVLLFAAAGPYVRATGVMGLVGLFSVSVMYMLLTKAFYKHMSLIIFTAVGVLYILLSFANVLPDAWTGQYDRSFILRQSFYIFMLYPLVVSAQRFWTHALKRGKMDVYMWILLVVCGLALMLNNAFYLNKSPFVLWGLLNPMALYVLAWGYMAYIRGAGIKLLLVPVLTVYFLMMGLNSQSAMVGFVFFMTGLLPYYRTLTVSFVGAILLATVLGAIFVDQLVGEDVNTVFRYLMWIHAIEGFLESYAMGIGFGKEVVTNVYWAIGVEQRYEAVDNILSAGVHNSYVSNLFRLGILGGGALIWFVLVRTFPVGGDYGRLANLSWFIGFFAIFVNVGVESPLTIVGVAMCWGLNLALRAREKVIAQERASAPL